MNNNHKTVDDRMVITNTSESDTTEDQVIAFMREAVAILVRRTGVEYASVKLDMTSGEKPKWHTYVHGGTLCVEETFLASLSKQVEAGPTARAQRMRRQAAELISLAEIVEGKAS